MARNTRDNVDACAFIHLQIDLGCPGMHRAGNSKCEGRAAEFRRIDAEEQVMHDRVADKYAVENVLRLDSSLSADAFDEAVDGVAHGLRHGFPTIRVHHHVGDAAHNVFTEANLGIGCACRSQCSA